MITVILLFAGLIVVAAGLYIAFAFGTKGGRSRQSGEVVANEQQQQGNPRGDVRSSGSGND